MGKMTTMKEKKPAKEPGMNWEKSGTLIHLGKLFLFFTLLLFTGLIYADLVMTLPEVMKPQRVYVDGEQVFITEGVSIYIYSLKDLKLQKKFGKKGEGPREFKNSGLGVILEIGPDTILITSSGRLSYFTRDGQFIKETRPKYPSIFEFQGLPGNRFVGTAFTREQKDIFLTINLYNENLERIKEIHRYCHPFFPRNKLINPVNVRGSTLYVYKDKIFFDDENGAINVLNSQGDMLYSVSPKYDKVKLTKIHKERYLMFWRTGIKQEYEIFGDRLKFPVVFPFIRNFHVVNDKIYIITHHEKDNKNEMLIFDLKGKLLKQVFVPLTDVNMLNPLLFNYYTINNDRLYIVRENEDKEEWELHAVTLK